MVSDEEIREWMGSIATTHPYWKAIDALLTRAVRQETEAAAMMKTGEQALRQAGRLSMILDFAILLRSEMDRRRPLAGD